MKARAAACVLSAAQWQKRRRVYLCVLWALALAPVLLPLGLYVHAALAYRPQPVACSDPLLREYLQALVGHDLVVSPQAVKPDFFAAPQLPGGPGQLPEALWQDWEARYGETADFWLLCLNARAPGTGYDAVLAGLRTPGAMRYLDAAYARGAVDWRVLVRLTRWCEGAWRDEAEAALHLPGLKRNATGQQQLERAAIIGAEVQRRHGAVRAELLARLLTLGADEAQAHYLAAQLAFNDGDAAGALAQLAAGNAATGAAHDQGPLFSTLQREAGEGRVLGGDRLLAGRVWCEISDMVFVNTNDMTAIVQCLREQALERRDARALSTLHRFCCRLASAPGLSEIEPIYASRWDKNLLRDFQALTPPPPPAQQKIIAAALAQQSAAHKQLLALVQSRQAQPAAAVGVLDRLLAGCAVSSSGGRGQLTAYYERACADLLRTQTGLVAVRREYVQLELLDPWK